MHHLIDREKELLGDYAKFYEKHYLGTLLFNKIIVQTIELQTEYADENFNTLKKELRKYKAFSLIRAILLYSEMLIPNRHPRIVLNITNRFEKLISAFENILKSKDYKVINLQNKTSIKRKSNLVKFGFCSWKASKILNEYKYSDLINILSNEEHMKQFDCIVEQQIKMTTKYLKSKNTKLVVISDVLSTHNLILVEAAKNIGIPCFSIPHGYPQTTFYHPIMVCDQVLAWNEIQRQRIAKDVGANKVKVFGYPRYDRKYLRGIIKDGNNAVIVYATNPSQSDDMRLMVYKNLKLFKDEGYEIRVRLHPLELKDIKRFEKSRELLFQFGYVLSNASLLEDIVNSYLVLGEMSSVLFEAYLIKNNAIQVYSKNAPPKMFFDEIQLVEIHELSKLLNAETVSALLQNSNSESLIDDFEEHVKMFIQKETNSEH